MGYPPRRSGYPPQYNVPSQAPSHRTPYMPGENQADISQFPALQRPHEAGYGGAPPVFVVSTYDARPINGVDFNTYSGTNAGGTANPDTGFDASAGGGGPFFTSSLFFAAQAGRVAVLRDWQISLTPATGEELGGELGNPIFHASGASNFRIVLDFLVDGVFQEAHSGRVIWQAAFGDVFGDSYILAQPGQTIEMRITGNSPGGSSWAQALMSMHGNLLLAKGYQVEFEPGSDSPIPVHESATERVGKVGV